MVLCHGGNGVTIITFSSHRSILEEQITTTKPSILITSSPFQSSSAPLFHFANIIIWFRSVFFWSESINAQYKTNKHVAHHPKEEEYRGTEIQLVYEVPCVNLKHHSLWVNKLEKDATSLS